jgi:hypothetical protein
MAERERWRERGAARDDERIEIAGRNRQRPDECRTVGFEGRCWGISPLQCSWRDVSELLHSADSLAALLRSSGDLAEAIANVIDALAAGLERSNSEHGCPLATVALERATQSEAVRYAAASGFDSWLEQIEQRLLAAGMTDAAAAKKALVLLSAIEGALILARAHRDVAPLAAVRAELHSILT